MIEGRARRRGVDAGVQPIVVDAAGDDGHVVRIRARQLDELGPRELGYGHHVARAADDDGQHRPLPGGVRAGVPGRLAQRGGVVDHDDVATQGHRGGVGRVQDEGRPARQRDGGQDRLLPRVAGAVGECARRTHDRVALGGDRRQAPGELARPALDAAGLGPDGGSGVDEHARHGPASSCTRR